MEALREWYRYVESVSRPSRRDDNDTVIAARFAANAEPATQDEPSEPAETAAAEPAGSEPEPEPELGLTIDLTPVIRAARWREEMAEYCAERRAEAEAEPESAPPAVPSLPDYPAPYLDALVPMRPVPAITEYLPAPVVIPRVSVADLMALLPAEPVAEALVIGTSELVMPEPEPEPTLIAAEDPDDSHPLWASPEQVLADRRRHWEGLLHLEASEVAQRSYKSPFKESRGELVERLLNPSLTLEETARLLGVCPTTVRRYTNREQLRHYRTPGNQRRFRLSDILEFLESEKPAEE